MNISALDHLSAKFLPAAMIGGLFLALPGVHAQAPKQQKRPYTTWSDYGGAADSSQYSSLTQINKANVKSLQVAWTYPTGDANNYLFNPLVVDGVMYVLAKNNSIVALDAATGKELWVHANPKGPITTRGINYWESKDRTERRLLFANNQFLHAIDAVTGEPIASFGVNGKVDLEKDWTAIPRRSHVQSIDARARLRGSDHPRLGHESGVRLRARRHSRLRRALRANSSGRSTRSRDPASSATTPGRRTHGKRSAAPTPGPRCPSIEKRGIVYVPTGSPKYNFYGANRKGAEPLRRLPARARCTHGQAPLALPDGSPRHLGLRQRHRAQAPDHPPRRQAARRRCAGGQDRVSFMSSIASPANRSGRSKSGRCPSPTCPAKRPGRRNRFRRIRRLSRGKRSPRRICSPFIEDPAERATFLDDIRSARNEGLFTPPGLRNTIQMPGNNGGANFSGAAIDPARGTMFVVSKDFPAMLKLVPPKPSSRRLGCVDGACRPGLHPLQQLFRLHDHEQRTLGDRTAVDDDDLRTT